MIYPRILQHNIILIYILETTLFSTNLMIIICNKYLVCIIYIYIWVFDSVNIIMYCIIIVWYIYFT